MIKIIAGKFKGQSLKRIKIENIRPTKSLVRKSVMDSIMFFEDKIILDLCCGIGSLGIEAISRGASSVDFVDNSRKSLKLLSENLELFKIENAHNIIYSDIIKFIKNSNKKYDIIFADPPYYKFDFLRILSYTKNMLKSGGRFIYESEKFHINNNDFKIKYFGNTQITIYEEK